MPTRRASIRTIQVKGACSLLSICRPQSHSSQNGHHSRSVRLHVHQKGIESAKVEVKQPQSLYSFIGNPRELMPDGLPFSFTDYLELVEWTGRVIREDKRGAIPSHLPDILQRLNIDPENRFTPTTEFERKTQRFVGESDQIHKVAGALGYLKPPGVSTAEVLFT